MTDTEMKEGQRIFQQTGDEYMKESMSVEDYEGFMRENEEKKNEIIKLILSEKGVKGYMYQPVVSCLFAYILRVTFDDVIDIRAEYGKSGKFSNQSTQGLLVSTFVVELYVGMEFYKHATHMEQNNEDLLDRQLSIDLMNFDRYSRFIFDNLDVVMEHLSRKVPEYNDSGYWTILKKEADAEIKKKVHLENQANEEVIIEERDL